ncbi:Protein kinase catalytic incomplete domain containing protein [Pandoravirus celtis]|uniref:Protein kinase catalytic incomplete domain containing protein n=1 Tax=Pandoravirus celtis TaxID=2568002 RepID=A0A4D6EG15_9VIRU|nr:Protein kinase catalytic incomplete domain containing protein [Pandoravirus celtis]
MYAYRTRNGIEEEQQQQQEEERALETSPPTTYIETTCPRWDVDAGHAWAVLDRRLDTYEQAADALQGALRSCICPRVDGAQAVANACSRLLVLSRRIGSPSADAEVYETVVLPRDHSAGADPFSRATGEDVHMAVKVLAIVGDDSAARNNTEMGIAQAVSDLVRAGVSPYFPLVYGTTYCDAVAYAPGSLLGAAARDYDLRQQMIEAAPPSRRRQMRALVRTAPDLASLGEALAAYGLAGIGEGQLDPDRPLPAHLLVSEMAWGDLSSVAERTPLTADQWFGVVRGVLSAIGALQSHLSVVHNDLHFGNILVAVVATDDDDDDNGTAPGAHCPQALLPLVHDFGRSYQVEVWMADDRVRDVEKVIEGLLSREVPPAVRAAAEELDRFVSVLRTRDYVMDEIINVWDQLAAEAQAGMI